MHRISICYSQPAAPAAFDRCYNNIHEHSRTTGAGDPQIGGIHHRQVHIALARTGRALVRGRQPYFPDIGRAGRRERRHRQLRRQRDHALPHRRSRLLLSLRHCDRRPSESPQ